MRTNNGEYNKRIREKSNIDENSFISQEVIEKSIQKANEADMILKFTKVKDEPSPVILLIFILVAIALYYLGAY